MSGKSPLVEVHLLGVPVDLWVQSSAHGDALQREFDIIRHGMHSDSVPARLTALINEVRGRFSGYGDPTNEELRRAADAGEPRIDVIYRLPAAAAEAAREIRELLREADAFCHRELITLTTAPEIVDFREWLLGEFSRQIDEGLPPTAWSRFRGEPAEPSDGYEKPMPARSEMIGFAGELDIATAGELRDRIRQSFSNGTRKLAIDLSEVAFIDSVGISLLVATHQRLADSGETLQVVVPSHLEALFEISGLTDIMDIKTVVE